MTDTNLCKIFNKNKPTLSLEVFPPKTSKGFSSLFDNLNKLIKNTSPDFISVTYGAGGSNQEKSIEVLEKINNDFKGAVVAHFTCIGQNKESIRSFIKKIEKMKIENILALRGDPPKNDKTFNFEKNIFKYSSELVSFIKQESNLTIGVAGYPEGHTNAPSKEIDWDNLKKKVDAGANFIITQLFFNNDDFFRFKEGMLKRGITVPLIPGILPVPSRESLDNIINLSGSRPTNDFLQICRKFTDSPDDFLKASIEYTQKQISELLRSKVPGIHYYTMNKSDIVIQVLNGL